MPPRPNTPGGRFLSSASFLAPSLSPDMLTRPELERRLGPKVAPRLTLVTGPPGYGKTTLVRSWLSTVASPWSWLTIDASSSHPDRFWPAVVRAVQLAVPEAVLNAVDIIGEDEIDGHAVVSELVEDLVARPDDVEPVVVVVDDAHLLGAQCWNDLEWLVAHQPPSFHLVIVSRSDPPFPVARLRALGWMTEVRQSDLTLTRAETAQLVSRWAGDAADAALVDDLQRRTEGWAAGVRLAVVALQRGAPANELLAANSVAHSMVTELLVSEALERQLPHVREFMQQTSILDVLEPGVCDALTRRSDSRAVLRRLAADHVFLAPLEGDVDRYRYHPLFSDVLGLDVRAVAGDARAAARRRAALHRDAALWFESQGRLAEAIRHAAAGGHHQLLFDLVVDNLAALYEAGHRHDVARWLTDLPDDFIVADADRAVDHCQALLFLVRPEWMRWRRRARAVAGDRRPDLLARLDRFEALGWAGQGRLDEFERNVEMARHRSADVVDQLSGDPFDEVLDAWRVRLMTLRGEHDEAVLAAGQLEHRPRVLLRDLVVRSLSAATLHAAGDPAGSVLVDQVIGAWRDLGEPDLTGVTDALFVASELALVRGDVDEAENLARSATAITSERPIHLLGARAEIAAAAVTAALGRPDEARQRLRLIRTTMAGQGAAPEVLALFDRAEPSALDVRRLVDGATVERLTDRELSILGYLAGHMTFPEIGRELFISRHTVKTHVARIYRKLEVSGRSEAVHTARELGLLPRSLSA